VPPKEKKKKNPEGLKKRHRRQVFPSGFLSVLSSSRKNGIKEEA
jgi:hypothetical protein